MKIHNKIYFLVIGLLVFISCSKGPKPIDYGNDGCHFCKMTIVDKIHGSELITEKGKVFKFDATECMLNYTKENSDLAQAILLTNYYEEPTKFINTKDANFLISEKLPSPMGAYLTAFKTKNSVDKILLEKGGEIYTWEELQAHLNK